MFPYHYSPSQSTFQGKHRCAQLWEEGGRFFITNCWQIRRKYIYIYQQPKLVKQNFLINNRGRKERRKVSQAMHIFLNQYI